MSAPGVHLLLAIHCHQPVGNFGFVLEQAFERAYEPFLAVLERHPAIRVTLHYSGNLLDWLQAHQPRFLERISRLAARRQVEVLASGYYEPILPLIPEHDRQGQLALMRKTLRRLCGQRPEGLWLTERVWEPELPQTLARSGIRYTLVDVNQFQSAAATLPAALQLRDDLGWDVLGCYVTAYGRDSVVLFPASKRLRYAIPFQDPSKTIELLRRAQRPAPISLTYADDGEKFGLWPKTREWVYGQGWLEQFFQAIERESSWLTTSTFSQYLAHAGPNGRVYLPCGSYEEMVEWSGGYFRNFFVKYPEADAMLQKMLSVSERLQRVASPKIPRTAKRKHSSLSTQHSTLIKQAQRELYMAQCNDAYWHGVFGGLYLAHLRRAVYTHLIQAERLLEKLGGRSSRQARAGLLLRNPGLRVVIDPEEDGAVTELDVLEPAVNLADTLSRRREPYHDQLRTAHPGDAASDTTPASIHDIVKVKQQGLETILAYDDHRRTGFLVWALSAMPTLHQIVGSTWSEYRLWSGGAWTLQPRTGRRRQGVVTLSRRLPQGLLRKTVTVDPRQRRLSFRCDVEDLEIPVLAVEFNLGLRDPRLAHPRWEEAADAVEIRDPAVGVGVAMRTSAACAIASFPIDTVSESEEGLERTPQGSAVVFLWPLRGQRRWSCEITWAIGALRGQVFG